MKVLIKSRPLLAIIFFYYLAMVASASVSARKDQEPVASANIEPPLDDDEATVQDDQHFIYVNNQNTESEPEPEEEEEEYEEEDYDDEEEVDPEDMYGDEDLEDLEPSIEDILLDMFDGRDPQGIHPEEPLRGLPQFNAPFPGSPLGVSLPGNKAPYHSRLVPINMPINQDLVNQIIGNDENGTERASNCSHCPCSLDDFSIPDGFVFDPTAIYDDAHRSKRSSDDDYWYNLKGPSKHLEKHDVYYAIQNDLRRRVEANSYPLHNGHIYTGNIGYHGDYSVHDRAFGHNSDFNFPYDTHAFKYKPHGPRLNKKWAKNKYPIFSHNLYKLREWIRAAEFGARGAGKVVTLKGGVYRFVSVTKKGDVLLTNVKTHQKFLIPRLFARPKESKKFQALGPWIDPNGLYFPVSSPILGGDSYIIKGSALTGNDPKKGNHLVYHGIDDIHPAPPGSLLNRKKGKKHPKDFKAPPKKPKIPKKH